MEVETKQRLKFPLFHQLLTLLLFMTVWICIIETSSAELVFNFNQLDAEIETENQLFTTKSRHKRDVTDTESENNDPKCAEQKNKYEDLRKKLKDGHRLETTVSS